MDQLTQLLQNKFGFSRFRPGQRETLERLQHRQSVLAVLPTGAGKTLIYQLYGALLDRPVVIVSPLLSLMTDQVERMQYGGEKRVVALNSQQSWTERQQTLAHLSQYRFIFISPEMLANQTVLRELQQLDIGLFVIDEAHCISQWAVDFRPDYLDLGKYWRALGTPQLLLLTATASQRVQDDIIKKLQAPNVQKLVWNVDRSNIFLAEQTLATETAKQDYLVKFVQQITGPGIIYFSSKKVANQMTAKLQAETDLQVAAYHADLDTAARFTIQHQFMDDELQLICATSAFGMGIDKANIRFVVHYHLPQDLESYMQEIGRAGRDGHQSLALLLYVPGDEQLSLTLVQRSIPTEHELELFEQHQSATLNEQIRRLLQYYHDHNVDRTTLLQVFQAERKRKEQAILLMVRYALTTECRRTALLSRFSSTKTADLTWCCDNDQPDWTVDQLGLAPTAPVAVPFRDWRQIIAELF
ncbi:RecQ family ATP-dependent DNA helicase [Fructilactobacillus myrtifloralis]|uniref:RecQ family ATP-dependent DNA helicase n=1 Tax=Fructilactobacillus myrtifloralis TaxID=2940301 RepID=A0ABY5BS10_9LACO|nr:RecQ family ATP-dependent DNA helicase [Fructilactobacillus myrtifloralis]USS85376.1 RecQ family ATP-dependent DNA helicase [Fructilactobacillus myrtifloralis]